MEPTSLSLRNRTARISLQDSVFFKTELGLPDVILFQMQWIPPVRQLVAFDMTFVIIGTFLHNRMLYFSESNWWRGTSDCSGRVSTLDARFWGWHDSFLRTGAESKHFRTPWPSQKDFSVSTVTFVFHRSISQPISGILPTCYRMCHQAMDFDDHGEVSTMSPRYLERSYHGRTPSESSQDHSLASTLTSMVPN